MESFETEQEFDEAILRFQNQDKNSFRAGEWVINQIFLDSLQYYDCDDKSVDKFMILGNCLKKIYQAKFGFLYPNHKVNVDFNPAKDLQNFYNYEVIAWQDFSKKFNSNYREFLGGSTNKL